MQRHAQANEETLSAYDGGFDSNTSSDDESEPKQKTIFELNLLFQLKLSIAGAVRMDNNNSIGTCTTEVINATIEII